MYCSRSFARVWPAVAHAFGRVEHGVISDAAVVLGELNRAGSTLSSVQAPPPPPAPTLIKMVDLLVADAGTGPSASAFGSTARGRILWRRCLAFRRQHPLQRCRLCPPTGWRSLYQPGRLAANRKATARPHHPAPRQAWAQPRPREPAIAAPARPPPSFRESRTRPRRHFAHHLSVVRIEVPFQPPQSHPRSGSTRTVAHQLRRVPSLLRNAHGDDVSTCHDRNVFLAVELICHGRCVPIRRLAPASREPCPCSHRPPQRSLTPPKTPDRQ